MTSERRTLHVALTYRWRPVETAAGQLYHFPDALSAHLQHRWTGPAVYRWRIYTVEPGDRREVYIGEAAELPRRLRGYLRPGPTQATNQRLNALFKGHNLEKRRVTLEVLEFEPFDVGGRLIEQDDLKDKFVRRFLEHLLLFSHQESGDAVMNI